LTKAKFQAKASTQHTEKKPSTSSDFNVKNIQRYSSSIYLI